MPSNRLKASTGEKEGGVTGGQARPIHCWPYLMDILWQVKLKLERLPTTGDAVQPGPEPKRKDGGQKYCELHHL